MNTVKLGEICDIASGGTPSRGNTDYWQNGSIPWIKISNIKGKYVSEADEFITEEGLSGSSAKLFSKAEGVLVGISSGAALFGATELAKKEENAGKNIAVILPDGGDRYFSTELFKD